MQKILYKLGSIIAFAPLVLSLIIFPFLPETIPTHFGLGGQPDAWSDKWALAGLGTFFLLPLVSLAVFGFLSCGWAKDTYKTLSPKLWEAVVLSVAIILLVCWAWIMVLTLTNT